MQAAQFELHAHFEQQHWWFVARRRIVRRLLHSLVPPGAGNLIVDVGCGTGANLAALAGDYRCLGIDTSADAIRLARARFAEAQFVQGFAPADLGPSIREARAVLLMDVLEHVPDDFRLLSELLAATAPGTIFLITVPAHRALWSRHDESFGHYRRYDRRRLAATWQDLPVNVRLLSYFNSRLYPAVRAVRTINRWRGESAGGAGTDFLPTPRPVNALLTSIFASEERRLAAVLEGRRPAGFRTGVSLIAVLERGEGVVEPRNKPAEIAADWYDPAAQQQAMATGATITG